MEGSDVPDLMEVGQQVVMEEVVDDDEPVVDRRAGRRAIM